MKSTLFLLSGALLIAGAYAADTPPAPNLHHLMKDVVAIQTQAIWDVSNNALDENGDPAPSKIKAADWAKLTSAAGKVKVASESLAQAPHVMAAAPGEKIDGEGATPGAFGAKQVQTAIDANPKVFQAFAKQLSGSMEEIVAATKTKDAKKVIDVAGRLDQECEGCHKQFWYPEQKAQR